MSKNSIKKIVYGENIFLSLFSLELIYLTYSFLIADQISLRLGADGFLNDNLYDSSHQVLVLSILIVPPFEELISRTYLNRKLNYFGLFFLFLLFISILFSVYSKTISIFFIILLIVLLLLGFYKGFRNLRQKAKNNFIYFFFASSFLFAFAHIPVIDSSYSVLNFGTRLIVVIFSIFPFAVILGLVRLKYGLKYSILLHIINNAVILTLNGVIYQ